VSCSGQHDLLSCYLLSPLCTLCRVRRSRSEGLRDKTKRLDPPREEKKESLVASRSNGAASSASCLVGKQSRQRGSLNNNRQNSARRAVPWSTVQGREHVIYLCAWLCTWPTGYLHALRQGLSLNSLSQGAAAACCIGEPIFTLSSDSPVTPRDCP
jgi:hypothetical protein